MKRLILLSTLFTGIAVNSLAGAAIAAAINVPPVYGAVALNAGALFIGVFNALPQGSLFTGVFTEVWTGEMIKAFRASIESIGWLNRIRSYDQYANNDVIHFVDIGGDPDVLVNNTSYPIPVQTLDDADKPVGLDKYQTKQTPVTDDELYAISYDKFGSVIERHRDSINETKYVKALHALAPASNSDNTPVIVTSGANSADGTRKTITRANIIALKAKFDRMKVPADGRILVLCSDHVNDLLENDQKFAAQYYNYTTGKIANLYGFEVYEFASCPYYTVSSKSKLAYGAIPAATDRQASIAFYAPRMMKATGSTNMYHSLAATDPANQQNMVNFRHYFICLPLKNEAIGAIVSDKN